MKVEYFKYGLFLFFFCFKWIKNFWAALIIILVVVGNKLGLGKNANKFYSQGM